MISLEASYARFIGQLRRIITPETPTQKAASRPWQGVVLFCHFGVTNGRARQWPAVEGRNMIVMTGVPREVDAAAIPVRPFQDPDPFHELVFANPIAARRAIADELRVPLATFVG